MPNIIGRLLSDLLIVSLSIVGEFLQENFDFLVVVCAVCRIKVRGKHYGTKQLPFEMITKSNNNNNLFGSFD